MKNKKFNYLTLVFSLITSMVFNSFPISVRAYSEATEEEIISLEETNDLKKSYVLGKDKIESNKTINDDLICYQRDLEIEKRNERYDEYIREYCNYFNLRSESVIEIAREYTNDYTTDSVISINGKEMEINNPEKFAMFLVYSLYNNSSEYGIDRGEVVSENSITYINEEDGGIVLSNGYTFNDYVKKVSSLVGLDSNLVLAISDYETGYQSSSQAENKNNFGGLKNGSGYMTFPTPEAGIISLAFTVDKIYYENNIDDMYDLSGVYVNGSVNRPSEHWVRSVSYIQNDISHNEEEFYTLKRTS